MNVLYLSPSFPPNYWHFPVELKLALSGYCQVVDMSVYEHVHRAAAYLVSQWGRIDRVAAQEEHWIDLEAALRQDFNVAGPKPDEIRHFRQKSLMKEVFRKAGSPAARGLVASHVEAGLEFARRRLPAHRQAIDWAPLDDVQAPGADWLGA